MAIIMLVLGKALSSLFSFYAHSPKSIYPHTHTGKYLNEFIMYPLCTGRDI